MSPDRSDGLRRAVELSPENYALRLVLAETLEQQGEVAEALRGIEKGELPHRPQD